MQALHDMMRNLRQLNEKPKTEYLSDWPSPCQLGAPSPQGEIEWLPVRRSESVDWRALEKALDTKLHDDIKIFYQSYFSDNLVAQTDRGGLTLLQAWNDDDFQRLQQNLVGHILMKKRLKQPLTVFFATTDDDDFILSLCNQTGQVFLERVGVQPQEVLAPSLNEFLSKLELVTT